MINEFWEQHVNPYFDVQRITEHGEELLRPTAFTRDILDIPSLGPHYSHVWSAADEDHAQHTARSARVNNRATNDPSAASPSLTPAPAPVTAIPPPSEVTSDAIGCFAAEGCERLHRFIQRTGTDSMSKEELSEMERIASQPHTAAVSVLAYISSTIHSDSPDPTAAAAVTDPDAKVPFDRTAYFFPSGPRAPWSPPAGVLRRAPSSAPDDRATLDATAEHVFAAATPAESRFLTGAHKEKHAQAIHNNNNKSKAHTSKKSALVETTAADDGEAHAEAATSSEPTPAPQDTPAPTDLPPPPLKPDSSTHQDADYREDHRAASSDEPAGVDRQDQVKPEPAETKNHADHNDGEDDEDDGGDDDNDAVLKQEDGERDSALALSAPDAVSSSSDGASDSESDVEAGSSSAPAERTSQAAKQPRARGAAASTTAKAPKQAGKAPRPTASKAPKQAGKAPRRSESREAAHHADSAASSSDSGDAIDSSDDESMTLSEEEDLRAEQEDIAAAAAEADSASHSQSHAHDGRSGLGAGKGPKSGVGLALAATSSSTHGQGKTPNGVPAPVGKQPRGTGSSGPATSERVFTMAPRRNDDLDDVESVQLEPIEEVDGDETTLPTPYFDLRAIDLMSAKEAGIRLPRPRLVKRHHQTIVENFPFVGVVHPALLAASCHYSQPPLLYNSHTMQLVEMNTRASAEEEKEEEESGADDALSPQMLQSKIHALHAEMEIVEVAQQQRLVDLLPPPLEGPASTDHLPTNDSSMTSSSPLAPAPLPAKENIYEQQFSTLSSARRQRAARVDAAEKQAEASSRVPSASPTPPTDAAADAVLPLSASATQLASLSVAPSYDDEVSAELWLAQRSYFSQVNHNNFTRSYLSDRGHASGDWAVSMAQIDQKTKQDTDTLELYDESCLLAMARQQRESRRLKFALSEAGQLRNVVRTQRMEMRNARHVQRLLKSMLVEVERRDKKRIVDERRHELATAREAKRLRRQAQEAQWKSRREAELHRRCENAIEHIIKQIEREVEGVPAVVRAPRKKRDPNEPKKPRIRKKKGDAAPQDETAAGGTVTDNEHAPADEQEMEGEGQRKNQMRVPCAHVSRACMHSVLS